MLYLLLLGLVTFIFHRTIRNRIAAAWGPQEQAEEHTAEMPQPAPAGRALRPRRPPFRTPRRPVAPVAPAEPKYAYETTPKDCAAVKRILATATNFPPELIDMVIDFAEYWACSVASIDFTNSQPSSIIGGSQEENTLMLRTEPLGLGRWHPEDQGLWRTAAPPLKLEMEYSEEEFRRLIDGPPSTFEHPFRKIEFDILSRDQGWGAVDPRDRNTYRHSWTWFDAGIDRFDKSSQDAQDIKQHPTTRAIRPVWPPLEENERRYNHALHADEAHLIQRNRLTYKEWNHHHIEWSWKDDIAPESSASEELKDVGRGTGTGDGSFIRNLKLGDMVTVWGRARFPGWRNNVQSVEVRVYWAL
ncbi:hypothetical protein F5Y16DRAFT_379622 [Xylariaceae sp. FL0255]|nr:hypothetical protein F5Y16DRAFT_379622 [Xylariaceae sp. FL0255]